MFGNLLEAHILQLSAPALRGRADSFVTMKFPESVVIFRIVGVAQFGRPFRETAVKISRPL